SALLLSGVGLHCLILAPLCTSFAYQNVLSSFLSWWLYLAFGGQQSATTQHISLSKHRKSLNKLK
ncbi:hypothetical protein B0H16DRAFT_1701219, partial [Mycena metata]